MAMFDHGPKGLDQIPNGCRNLRGVSCGKQPLLHKVKLPTLLGWPSVGGFILIDLFPGSSVVKMRLEVKSEQLEVINSHLVIIGYNSGLSKAWKSGQNIKPRKNPIEKKNMENI